MKKCRVCNSIQNPWNYLVVEDETVVFCEKCKKIYPVDILEDVEVSVEEHEREEKNSYVNLFMLIVVFILGLYIGIII